MKYYPMQNPEGMVLATTDFYRAIVRKASLSKKKDYLIIRLSLYFPVGSIFHILNSCENFLIRKLVRSPSLEYHVYKCDGEITEDDLKKFKVGTLVFRDGFMYDKK